jgi:hypothetical protein
MSEVTKLNLFKDMKGKQGQDLGLKKIQPETPVVVIAAFENGVIVLYSNRK